MRKTITLYWQHDLDIIYLAACPNKDLNNEIKYALKAYIHGIKHIITVPEWHPEEPVLLDNMSLYLTLKENEDMDIINFLEQVKPGLRNNIIKNILRSCFNTPCVIPYTDINFITKSRVKLTAKKAGNNGSDKKSRNAYVTSENSIKKDPEPHEVYISADIKESSDNVGSIPDYDELKNISNTPKAYTSPEADETDIDNESDDFDFFGAFSRLMGD